MQNYPFRIPQTRLPISCKTCFFAQRSRQRRLRVLISSPEPSRRKLVSLLTVFQGGMLRVVSDIVKNTVNEENDTEDSGQNCREADLLLLIKSFRSLYTGSYANIRDAAKLCHDCLVRPFELRKHLVASEDTDDIDEEDCMTFVRLLNKQQNGYINWRAMVCNMAVSWVPTLRQSTVYDFASAANVKKLS